MTFKDVQQLVRVRARAFLPSLDLDLQLHGGRVVSIVRLPDDGGVEVTTDRPHCLYRFDSVHWGNCCAPHGCSRVHDVLPQVEAVLGPCCFHLSMAIGDVPFAVGEEVNAPLNMHKLAPEVVVPLTTVEEIVLHLTGSREAKLLLQALDQSASNLTLKRNVLLPDTGIHLAAGLTVHGCLSANGHVRREYWKMGDRRVQAWLTGDRHDRRQVIADPVGIEGEFGEEQTFATRADIITRVRQGGVWLVLRRGVSYAAVCHTGLPITDFISHNWSEPSRDFVKTLKVARVHRAWICTFAVCQHCIPPLSGPYTGLPFYQALKELQGSGRVVMALDNQATVLTRIWCVFECWVSTDLQLRFQMFLPSGELNFWSRGAEAEEAKAAIDELDPAAARSSVPADKTMILGVIGDHMNDVRWQTKRKLCTGALLFMASLITDTSTFVFAVPWVFSISHEWVSTTFFSHVPEDHEVWQAHAFAVTVTGVAAAYHLRNWVVFARCTDMKATIKGLLRTLSMGSSFAKVLAILAFCEILNVVILTTTTPLWEHPRYMICERDGVVASLGFTVYLVQKAGPWAAGFAANRLRRRSVNLRDFEPAAPRIGFLVMLTSLCVLMWRRTLTDIRDPFCASQKTSLSHLKFNSGFGLVHMIVVGVSAWGVSVAWSFAVAVAKRYARLSERCRVALFIAWFAGCVVLLVLLWYFGLLSVLWKENWLHLELGAALWLTTSAAVHRRYLAKWARWCYRQWRQHRFWPCPLPLSMLVPRESDIESRVMSDVNVQSFSFGADASV